MLLGWCGGGQPVGETQQPHFQLSFNSSLRVDFQGARVTSDGGLLVVRELDERLRLSELVNRNLSDSRRGKNIQLSLADLLRQSIARPLLPVGRGAPDPATVWRDAAVDRGAAAGGRIRRVQSGADLNDDAGAQWKGSAEPPGKRRIAGRCVPTGSDTGPFRRR